MNAMPSPAFDTHATVKRLIQAGASESLAEAIVSAVQPATTMPDVSNLATKADLEIISTKMAPLATREDLANVRAEIIRWLFGGIAVLILTTTIEHFLK